MLFAHPIRSFPAGATLAMLVLAGLTVLRAQPPAAASVYTAAQAQAGGAGFQATCAGCHSNDLSGNGDAPELAGRNFMSTWRSQTTQDLFKYVQGMPPGGPHLPSEEYLPIVAYILEQNGAIAGEQPFSASTTASIGEIATGERPAVGR